MTATAGAGTGEAVRFVLPADLEASEPPEVRGRGRHDVRMMVARRAENSLEHRRFTELVDVLAAGDLVVVNTSATVPAALAATRADGTRLLAHLSTRLPGGRWLVELRVPQGTGSRPFAGGGKGEILTLGGGGTVELLGPWEPAGHRLWIADLSLPVPLASYLAPHGSPVRYGHVRRRWPIGT